MKAIAALLATLGAVALSGCAPKQESEAISKSGNQFLEEEKREAPKVEQAAREAEAIGRKAHEEKEAMKAKGEWQGTYEHGTG